MTLTADNCADSTGRIDWSLTRPFLTRHTTKVGKFDGGRLTCCQNRNESHAIVHHSSQGGEVTKSDQMSSEGRTTREEMGDTEKWHPLLWGLCLYHAVYVMSPLIYQMHILLHFIGKTEGKSIRCRQIHQIVRDLMMFKIFRSRTFLFFL